MPPDVRRSARLLQLLVVALSLIAAGVVGALGGFARADGHKQLPAGAIDQPIDAGSWQVTVHSASAGTRLHGNKANDGTYLIEVEATVLIKDSRTRAVFDVLQLEGVPDVQSKEADLTSVRDERLASYLQPGLAERIAFAWEVKSTTPVPKEVRVIVVGEHPRPTNFYFLGETMHDQAPQAAVTVSVVAR